MSIVNFSKHPETQPGEVFVSNLSSAQFRDFDWKSKRKGRIPYDGQRNRVQVTDWFPVFVTNKELQARQTDLVELRRILRRDSGKRESEVL